MSYCRKYSQVNSSVLCFRKIPVAKKLMDKRGEYEDFPSEIFSVTVAKIFIGESFTIAVFLGTGNVWITRGGGEYQVFPSKKFCLTVPKILVEQSFPVALIQGTEKVWLRGGGVSRYSVEFVFVSQRRKIS